MDYAQLIEYINEWIKSNGNREITADVLNPVLRAIADWARSVEGDLANLSTTDKSNLVAAINEVNLALANVNINGPQVYQGIPNPNTTPPPSYKAADFYLQLDAFNTPVALFIYDGFVWQNVTATFSGAITGLIVAGTNITITGTGTLSDPYIINSSGGGGSQDLQSVVTEGNSFTKTVGDYTYTYEVFGSGGYKVKIENDVTGDVSQQIISAGYYQAIVQEGNNGGEFLLGDGTEPSILTTGVLGGQNYFKIPFRTGSGITEFYLPNDKPGGSYIVALEEDIPTDLAELGSDATHRVVTDAQIASWNAVIGGSVFQSVWNASTNSPALASGTGTKGYYYIVNTVGTTNLDGITDWKVGDWAIYDGTVWRKVDNTDAVSSVNGLTGAVSLDTSNVPDTLNKRYQTDAQQTNNDATSSIQTQLNGKASTSYADAKVQNSLTASTTVAPSATAVNTGLNARVKVVIKDLTLSAAINSTTSELILTSYLIPAGTYSANDIMTIMSARFTSAGAGGTVLYRHYLHTSAGTPGSNVSTIAGANLLGGFNQTTAGSLNTKIGPKTYAITGGNIQGNFAVSSSSNSDGGQFSSALGSFAFNVANDIYFITTAQPSVSNTNNIRQTELYITN